MSELTIREASKEDIPRILEMGRRFLHEGPYRSVMPDNPEVAIKLALSLITQPSAKILVAQQGEEVVGVFCFVIFPHYYSGLMTAGELIWYVEPEARKSRAGLELKWAAENLAKKMGAAQMHLTCPPGQAPLFDQLRGYKQVEVGYQRTL